MDKYVKLVPLALLSTFCVKLLILGSISLADMGVMGFLSGLSAVMYVTYKQTQLDAANKRIDAANAEITALQAKLDKIGSSIDEAKTAITSLRLLNNSKTSFIGGNGGVRS